MNVALLVLVALLALAAAAAASWAMRERVLRKLAEGGGDLFRLQAQAAATEAAEAAVRKADEALARRDALAEEKLASQLKPVAESLAKFERHVADVEKSRAEQAGEFKSQLRRLLEASDAAREEARRLSQSLRRGAGVQGRWGEEMLRNVLEIAGLRPHIDFDEQVHLEGLEASYRPDVVVRLPGKGQFVIDAKCSLTAFLESMEAADEAQREAALARHATSLRAHLQKLCAKSYWDKLEHSPEFVVMFVPGDGFLAAACERIPSLMNEGWERNVILATPTSLFGLAKAVHYGWRAETQARNAREIARIGRELHRRLSTMGGHVQEMGKALARAVDKYNAFIGSLERQVLAQARRFEDLGAEHPGAPIEEPQPIEALVRPLARLEIDPAPALTAPEPAPTSAK
ncbi:MAG: DNA recombination protein RmuC, partial [Caulobacteraceae bacterium]